MKLGKWNFTPHVWPTVGAIVLIAGFSWLASWQFDRAGQKRALINAIHAGAEARPVDLNATVHDNRTGRIPRYRHVVLRGHYDGEHQILASEIMHDSQRGYYVLTPFYLAGTDNWVIINRGWIADTGSPVAQSKLAVPDNPRTLTGLWTHLPRPGLRLGPPASMPEGWPKTLLYPTHDQLAGILNRPLLGRSVWLEPDAPAGFVRDWKPKPRFGPTRHIGYAVQWMALGLTVLIVWIALNLHKHERKP